MRFGVIPRYRARGPLETRTRAASKGRSWPSDASAEAGDPELTPGAGEVERGGDGLEA